MTNLTQSFQACHWWTFNVATFFPGHPYIMCTTVRHDILPQAIKHYSSKALANIIPRCAHHSLGSLLWRRDVSHYGSAQADIAFEQPTNNPGHHKNSKAV